MITLHFHLIPQYKYELLHIYFTLPLLVITVSRVLRVSTPCTPIIYIITHVLRTIHYLNYPDLLPYWPRRSVGKSILEVVSSNPPKSNYSLTRGIFARLRSRNGSIFGHIIRVNFPLSLPVYIFTCMYPCLHTLALLFVLEVHVVLGPT